MTAKEDKPTAGGATSNGMIDEASFLREQQAREKAENLLSLSTQDAEKLSRALRAAEEELKKATDELNEAKTVLKKLSSSDTLTNLPNRNQLDNDLEREIARSKRYNRQLALLYLDLDHFKKINESYGHDFGDLLLKEASLRLQNLLRTEDLIARLGGDEFAIILTEIDNPHDAGVIAHRIVEKMAEPYEINGHFIHISISIGIACYPDAGVNGTALQKGADIALHCAKSAGRSNYQFFTSDLQEQHNSRLELEAALHFALEKNEFFLLYQPRINIQSGNMACMEVLLHWQHKNRGVMTAADFIPLAAETGLIIPIGMWMLKTACQQFAEWHFKDKNLQCSLAINVLPRQLQHKNFIEMLKKILDETHLPPQFLTLEITEPAVTNYLGKIEEALFQLRHLGVQFSIKNATTEHTSVTHIKTQHTNTKISDNLIIKSTIALANDMGLNVVAEGVEAASQLQLLINSHCPQAQGYFYSNPLTSAQMSDLIAKKVESSAS